MKIIAIDPGPKESGYVRFDTDRRKIFEFGKLANNVVLRELRRRGKDLGGPERLVIEMIGSYGHAVGREVFGTCVFIGQCSEAFGIDETEMVTRSEVKQALFGTQVWRVNGKPKGITDADIRADMIERFGGQDKAIGGIRCKTCKGKGWVGRGRPTCTACDGEMWEEPPGPLNGVSTDTWQALALAVAFAEMQELPTQGQCHVNGISD